MRAVIDGDLDMLCSVPGHRAQDRRPARARPEGQARPAGRRLLGPCNEVDGIGRERAEVRGALQELGYGPDEIRVALEAVPETGTVEELLRQALEGAGDRRGTTGEPEREVIGCR